MLLLLLWDVVPLQNTIAVGEFADTPTEAAVIAVGAQFGYPLMLKAKKMAYDGKVYCIPHSLTFCSTRLLHAILYNILWQSAVH
jgi:phosphoribosylaminoimidazole carboxylase (NCAIR synthetase)